MLRTNIIPLHMLIWFCSNSGTDYLQPIVLSALHHRRYNMIYMLLLDCCTAARQISLRMSTLTSSRSSGCTTLQPTKDRQPETPVKYCAAKVWLSSTWALFGIIQYFLPQACSCIMQNPRNTKATFFQPLILNAILFVPSSSSPGNDIAVVEFENPLIMTQIGQTCFVRLVPTEHAFLPGARCHPHIVVGMGHFGPSKLCNWSVKTW